MRQTAIFGAGCFWGVEHTFNQLPGVIEAVSGYAGGDTENPTYEEVCSGATGHAEVVQVRFEADEISYQQLLDVFWQIHDPTTLNRQGPDIGSQYRSVIYTTSPEQYEEALASKLRWQESGKFGERKIVTEIKENQPFWPAEEYHQRYFEKHPGHAACHFVPKLVY